MTAWLDTRLAVMAYGWQITITQIIGASSNNAAKALADHLETLRYRELVADKLKGGDGTTSPDGRATA